MSAKKSDEKIKKAFTVKDWNEIKTSDSWQIFKILSEFVDGFEPVAALAGIRPDQQMGSVWYVGRIEGFDKLSRVVHIAPKDKMPPVADTTGGSGCEELIDSAYAFVVLPIAHFFGSRDRSVDQRFLNAWDESFTVDVELCLRGFVQRRSCSQCQLGILDSLP